MSLSTDLLLQAEHLVSKEPKRPKQASLRRATSDAYYALFHFLTWASTELIAPNIDTNSRLRMVRWFEHAAMYKTCGVFAAPTLKDELARLAGTVVDADIQKLARNFRQLQQERHIADYDLGSNWNRPRARQAIQDAKDAMDAWKRVKRNSQANIFALALLDLDRTQKNRG